MRVSLTLVGPVPSAECTRGRAALLSGYKPGSEGDACRPSLEVKATAMGDRCYLAAQFRTNLYTMSGMLNLFEVKASPYKSQAELHRR